MHLDHLSYEELQNVEDFIVQPPHNIPAEQSVLGGLLMDPNKLGDCLDIISDVDFYRGAHIEIFRAIVSLSDDNQGIDTITVGAKLEDSGKIEDAGGLSYLIELASNTPGSRNILAYCKGISNKATERKLFLASQQVMDAAKDETLSTEDKVLAAQRAVLEIETFAGEEVEQINEGLKSVVAGIDERYNSDGSLIGLSTGYPDIDARMGGLCGSDLIILGARPSMGKTTFAMNIAESCAMQGNPVLVFSMEMPERQLLERMTSSASGVPYSFIRSGNLRDEHWPMLSNGIQKLKDAPLFIDDRASLSISQMRSTARKLHKKGGIKLIVVDYIQLAASKGENRTQEITEISRGLKAIAKELDIPVIAISQLNRSLESRGNKRPINSDLRESGAIEQDADIIIFLYRDEIYDADTVHKGIVEVIFGKGRNFPIGTDHLKSNLHINRFDHLSGPIPELSSPTKGFSYD